MKPSDIQDKYIRSDGKFHYYSLKWSSISSNVKNWSKNRFIDQDRVNEMYETYKAQNHLHFFIHLAFHKKEKTVYYDGAHRIAVLDRLIEEDVEEPYIFISIMWECTDEDIFTDFRNLNRQCTVPEMHIKDAQYTDEFKANVDRLVKWYKEYYKDHYKTSNYPKAPHFEENQFKNEIVSIYDKLSKKCLKSVENGLKKYNDVMRSEAEKHIKRNSKQWQKCEKNDFWLFVSKPLNIDRIVDVIEKSDQ